MVNSSVILLIMTAVTSITPYLTDKCEHTPLYKINKTVHIRTSKMIIIQLMMLYFKTQCREISSTTSVT